MSDPVIFLIGIICGGVFSAAIFYALYIKKTAVLNAEIERLKSDKLSQQDSFAVMAQKALEQSSETFLRLAKEKLNEANMQGSHDLEKRQKAVAEMIKPVSDTLKEMETRLEALGKAGAGIESRLKDFAQDQRLLRTETQNLVRTLRNPATRGHWGEMQFQRTLEMIGMIEGTHYEKQCSVSTQNDNSSSVLRPDFVIKLSGGLHVVIDVKAPVEPYWDMVESSDSEAENAKAAKTFTNYVRGHIKKLSSKEYWRSFDSPDFVVMFLPTEGLYATAISEDPSILDDAAKGNVIIASPSTVIGLLRVIMYGWHQKSIAEEAKKISELGSDLYKRVFTFSEHMQKVGANLNRSVESYNKAVGSLEVNVLSGARKLKDCHVLTGGKEIEQITQIDSNIRSLSIAPSDEI